mmetsp:Transcript_23826/g.43022  ORF Transcript_23826/g.43022 Transcript_23826/m.43022 type:complete len:219 (+) Transcript_23826:912-1568(+)
MHVGFEPDQRTERSKEQRKRQHPGHKAGGHRQLDNHHAVEDAHNQDKRHTNGDLKKRKSQQSRQRHVVTRHIRKGQVLRAEARQFLRRECAVIEHVSRYLLRATRNTIRHAAAVKERARKHVREPVFLLCDDRIGLSRCGGRVDLRRLKDCLNRRSIRHNDGHFTRAVCGRHRVGCFGRLSIVQQLRRSHLIARTQLFARQEIRHPGGVAEYGDMHRE